jgi:hypothetical protein
MIIPLIYDFKCKASGLYFSFRPESRLKLYINKLDEVAGANKMMFKLLKEFAISGTGRSGELSLREPLETLLDKALIVRLVLNEVHLSIGCLNAEVSS